MCFDQFTGKSFYDFIFDRSFVNGTDGNGNYGTNDSGSSEWKSYGFFTAGDGGRCFVPGISSAALQYLMDTLLEWIQWAGQSVRRFQFSDRSFIVR